MLPSLSPGRAKQCPKTPSKPKSLSMKPSRSCYQLLSPGRHLLQLPSKAHGSDPWCCGTQVGSLMNATCGHLAAGRHSDGKKLQGECSSKCAGAGGCSRTTGHCLHPAWVVQRTLPGWADTCSSSLFFTKSYPLSKAAKVKLSRRGCEEPC